jgi:hypothetical protein
LREGVGGWGLVKIAIYFCPAYMIRNKKGINLKPVF